MVLKKLGDSLPMSIVGGLARFPLIHGGMLTADAALKKILSPLCIGIQRVVGPALAFAMGMKGVANFPFCHPLFLGRIELSTIYLLLPLFGTFLLFSSCYWACQLDWRSFSAIDRILLVVYLLSKTFEQKS